MLAPLSAAATDQVNLGDVFSTQTLNVDTVTDTTAAVTTATGNTMLSGAETGSLNVPVVQINGQPDASFGNIKAKTTLTVANTSGETTLTTAATGNSVEADISGGGSLTGTFIQTTNGIATPLGDPPGAGLFISAENDIYAPSGAATDMSALAQAIANSVSIGATGSLASPIINQTNAASVTSIVDHVDSVEGSEAALLDFTAGTAAFTAISVANNVAITGISAEDGTGSSEYINSSQYTNGASILAGVLMFVNDGQTVQGASAVSANNISVNNMSGDLNLTNVQTNDSYTQADTVVGAYEFGTAAATASGVGNSALAANYGASTEFSNNQTNNAEVIASASFSGGNSDQQSYDATASSSAIGNGATAFSCSDCGGVIDETNNQINSNTISATTLVDVSGVNRSVTATATAVGNSATFYNSKPK
jgi:hypothetical protein